MSDDGARALAAAARNHAPAARVDLIRTSRHAGKGFRLALVEVDGEPRLFVHQDHGDGLPFEGDRRRLEDGGTSILGPLSAANARVLRSAVPFTAPSSLGEEAVTIGLGDRLGIAGPGHLRAIGAFSASPVLAQQSPRELTLTGRSFAEVLDAATWAVCREGWREPWGADADHVKTEEQIAAAMAAGFTMITADVSDSLHSEWVKAGEAETAAAYDRLDPAVRSAVEKRHERTALALGSGETLRLSPPALARAVLMYGDALDHAARLYRASRPQAPGGKLDFELSIDETDSPTTPEAHLFIAAEARFRGIELTSLAPRFVGEFQKAIDYIGSVAGFEASFAVHAEIARHFGYRISVHSGSDKFSLYPSIGRLTGGRFHLKTSGTSWLESLRVIAASDPRLFASMYAEALAGYADASRLYHVTPRLDRLPPADGLSSAAMAALLDDDDARQVLHITYGRILANKPLRERAMEELKRNGSAYLAALERHIGHHLEALGVPRRPGTQGR